MPRLAMQRAVAWMLPERAWWPLSRMFGPVNALTHPDRNRCEAAKNPGGTCRGTSFYETGTAEFRVKIGPTATRSASNICALGAQAAGRRLSRSSVRSMSMPRAVKAAASSFGRAISVSMTSSPRWRGISSEWELAISAVRNTASRRRGLASATSTPCAAALRIDIFASGSWPPRKRQVARCSAFQVDFERG